MSIRERVIKASFMYLRAARPELEVESAREMVRRCLRSRIRRRTVMFGQ